MVMRSRRAAALALRPDRSSSKFTVSVYHDRQARSSLGRGLTPAASETRT
jgi:hypothetical protein